MSKAHKYTSYLAVISLTLAVVTGHIVTKANRKWFEELEKLNRIG